MKFMLRWKWTVRIQAWMKPGIGAVGARAVCASELTSSGSMLSSRNSKTGVFGCAAVRRARLNTEFPISRRNCYSWEVPEIRFKLNAGTKLQVERDLFVFPTEFSVINILYFEAKASTFINEKIIIFSLWCQVCICRKKCFGKWKFFTQHSIQTF